MSLLRLAPELQQKVNEGWDIERAYLISQTPDHEKQRALAAQSGLSRNELRQTVKDKATQASGKLSVARFPLPNGTVVSVQSSKLTMSTCIDCLLETTKQLKKAQADSIDLGTAIRVMTDKAKPSI